MRLAHVVRPLWAPLHTAAFTEGDAGQPKSLVVDLLHTEVEKIIRAVDTNGFR